MDQVILKVNIFQSQPNDLCKPKDCFPTRGISNFTWLPEAKAILYPSFSCSLENVPLLKLSFPYAFIISLENGLSLYKSSSAYA